MTTESSPECRRVIYRGRVQGVGFRWTAARLAGGYLIQGFVRNRSDGSVELLAQGAAAEVRAFLEDVASSMGANIEGADETEESLQADLSAFTIRQ